MNAINNHATMKVALLKTSCIILNGFNSKNTTLQATGFDLLSKLSESEKHDNDIFEAMNEIPGFIQAVKEPFSIHKAYLENDYGGSLSIYTDNEADQLTMKAMKIIGAW